MADPQHIEFLKRGPKRWNKIRAKIRFLPDLSDADLGDLDLMGAWLDECYLKRANFSGADLRHAHLMYSNLREAKLVNAKLDDANMVGCNLSHADFTGASLIGTYLPSSTLIEGLDVRGVDLSQTKGLDRRYIHLMRGDHSTKLPSRLEMPEEWKESEELPAPEPIVPAATINPAATTTPVVSVTWTDEGLDARFHLSAREPSPRLFHPHQQMGASMDILASLGQLSKQICASLEREERQNFAAIAGDIAIPFEAIESEVNKPEGAVLSFVIDVNLRTIERLFAQHSEALTDVDRELVFAFLELGQKWRASNGVLKEIEDPTNSEIVPVDRLDQIESAVNDMKALLLSDENTQYLGPSLSGVTRQMALYPWDPEDPQRHRRMSAAAFGALAHQIWKQLTNPPAGVVTTGGFYVTLLGTITGLLSLFMQ